MIVIMMMIILIMMIIIIIIMISISSLWQDICQNIKNDRSPEVIVDEIVVKSPYMKDALQPLRRRHLSKYMNINIEMNKTMSIIRKRCKNE